MSLNQHEALMRQGTLDIKVGDTVLFACPHCEYPAHRVIKRWNFEGGLSLLVSGGWWLGLVCDGCHIYGHYGQSMLGGWLVPEARVIAR